LLETKSQLASRLSRPFLYVPLALSDLIRNSTRTKDPGCELRWTLEFDHPFDEFWVELARQNPQRLLADRDRETFPWQFRYDLEEGRVWVLTASEGNRLLAYAILERRIARTSQLERMLLVDFQTIVPERGLATAVLSCALERCRDEGISILENIGCWFEET